MDKIAVITGASSGIGKALSLELANRGISVIAIARNVQALQALKAEHTDKINFISADISQLSDNEKILNELKNTRITYLIHCAGQIQPIGLLKDASPFEIRQAFEVNLFAPLFLTNALLALFNAQEGRILNITSVAGEQAVNGVGAYCISKSAFNMWTAILQAELPKHIVATQVIPGEVDTNMQKKLREAPLPAFPLAKEFQLSYEKNTLISPTVCADFLANVLLNTDPHHFAEKKWNIYKDYNKPLPSPFNKDKLAE